MSLLAIDPGTEESAYVLLEEDNRTVVDAAIVPNDTLLELLMYDYSRPGLRLVLEMVACYGMPVGAETFQTCVWIGRFIQVVYPLPVELMTRNQVKMALCHTIKGVNDSVIRQRLIDMYGPTEKVAKGNKKQPGPLYGIHHDMWAALALGVAFLEQEPATVGGGK